MTPSTTGYEFGDVLLVPFPFTDQTATKQRPAVVISSSAYHRERSDLIIVAVTSQARSTNRTGEVAVAEWQSAGLLKPSVIKPVVATIDRQLVRRWLGHLAAPDLAALAHALLQIIGTRAG
jgi:mRNA interferase MazF